MTELLKMQEHEKLCREQNNSLIYCSEQINAMVGLAAAAGFGLVVEVYGEDDKAAYYTVKTAEIEAAKRRCKITLNYENKDKQAAQNARADKKSK